MHKHILAWLSCILGLVLVIVFSQDGHATNSVSWINSPLSLQKQSDTQLIPNSLSGNIDCYIEGSNCAVETAYGSAANGLRLNGSSKFLPVLSYIDQRQHFLPIPNLNAFMTFTTEPAIGLYLYFNYNFLSSVRPEQSLGQENYKVIKPPDAVLQDKTNHRLAADYNSMSFSQNGQWMVVAVPNVATVRVNLQTFEVLPFGPRFDYMLGLDPAPKTAITNDGRYALVASKNSSQAKIYDLASCDMVPDIISAPVNCQSRDLKALIMQQFPGFGFIDQARFLDDSLLSIYANYETATGSKTARFLLGTGLVAGQIDYLAMGDSYISGEGAFNYQVGTDTDINRCHLSLISYPYLLARSLNYNSYHSVACSGAVMDDINDLLIPNGVKKSQVSDKKDPSYDDEIYSNFLPGYRAQLNFTSRYQPKVINLSVGGNDMGFSQILKACATSIGTCYDTYEDRLELTSIIDSQVFPRLVKTYSKIKASTDPGVRLYVIGYPQIAKPGGNCAVNVRLNNDEIVFSQELISYLDSVIQAASARAGVYYVDVQDALNGHRLCEAGSGSVAMNGLTAGNDRPSRLGGPIADESYHPNDFGHQLLESKILQATHNLTAVMPPEDLSASPSQNNNFGILNVPHSGRQVKVSQYDPDISSNLLYKRVPANIEIAGSAHGLSPGSLMTAELHSNPVSLGSFLADASGNISGPIQIPADVPAGFHELHFFGADLTGQAIDIYKIVYIAGNSDDLDDDGVADINQSCVGVEPAGQDFDQDSIDDACDGTIGQPPNTVGLTDEMNLASQNPIARTQAARSSQTLTPSRTLTTSRTLPGKVLAAATKALPTGNFNPGWLLALTPSVVCILYFIKARK